MLKRECGQQSKIDEEGLRERDARQTIDPRWGCEPADEADRIQEHSKENEVSQKSVEKHRESSHVCEPPK